MTCPPCTHNCRQGRDCKARIAGLHDVDGGHEVHGALSFPIEREYADDAPITTPESAETWAVVAQVLFIAIVVGCLAAAFIQIVLPPFYR
jgi:hypothetical protein